jgi:hypothetical protein
MDSAGTFALAGVLAYAARKKSLTDWGRGNHAVDSDGSRSRPSAGM